MFKRYWVIILAFGLIGLGHCVVYGQSPEDAKGDKANAERSEPSDQSKSNQIVFPVRILENPPKTEADQRDEQEAEQREKEDLVAQQSVAESTEKILWLSGLQMILAVIGTGALIYSILLNRKATNAAVVGAGAAVSGADAARDAVEVARKMGDAQTRAWLGFNSYQILLNKGDNGLVHEIHFRLLWKNYGITPALDTNITTDRADSDVFESEDPFARDAQYNACVPPGAEPAAGLAVKLPIEEFLATKDDPVGIVSMARYKTVADTENFKNSRVEIELRYVGLPGLSDLQKGSLSPSSVEVRVVGFGNIMT